VVGQFLCVKYLSKQKKKGLCVLSTSAASVGGHRWQLFCSSCALFTVVEYNAYLHTHKRMHTACK
jgi:hypothetical protein